MDSSRNSGNPELLEVGNAMTASIEPSALSNIGALQARSSKDTTVYGSHIRSPSMQLFGKYQIVEDKEKLD